MTSRGLCKLVPRILSKNTTEFLKNCIQKPLQESQIRWKSGNIPQLTFAAPKPENRGPLRIIKSQQRQHLSESVKFANSFNLPETTKEQNQGPNSFIAVSASTPLSKNLNSLLGGGSTVTNMPSQKKLLKSKKCKICSSRRFGSSASNSNASLIRRQNERIRTSQQTAHLQSLLRSFGTQTKVRSLKNYGANGSVAKILVQNRSKIMNSRKTKYKPTTSSIVTSIKRDLMPVSSAVRSHIALGRTRVKSVPHKRKDNDAVPKSYMTHFNARRIAADQLREHYHPIEVAHKNDKYEQLHQMEPHKTPKDTFDRKATRQCNEVGAGAEIGTHKRDILTKLITLDNLTKTAYRTINRDTRKSLTPAVKAELKLSIRKQLKEHTKPAIAATVRTGGKKMGAVFATTKLVQRQEPTNRLRTDAPKFVENATNQPKQALQDKNKLREQYANKIGKYEQLGQMEPYKTPKSMFRRKVTRQCDKAAAGELPGANERNILAQLLTLDNLTNPVIRTLNQGKRKLSSPSDKIELQLPFRKKLKLQAQPAVATGEPTGVTNMNTMHAPTPSVKREEPNRPRTDGPTSSGNTVALNTIPPKQTRQQVPLLQLKQLDKDKNRLRGQYRPIEIANKIGKFELGPLERRSIPKGTFSKNVDVASGEVPGAYNRDMIAQLLTLDNLTNPACQTLSRGKRKLSPLRENFELKLPFRKRFKGQVQPVVAATETTGTKQIETAFAKTLLSQREKPNRLRTDAPTVVENSRPVTAITPKPAGHKILLLQRKMEDGVDLLPKIGKHSPTEVLVKGYGAYRNMRFNRSLHFRKNC